MKRNQSASQSTPDINTVFLLAGISRTTWVVGVYRPTTDDNIGTHK
ncbi:MAG: hypothetical protein OXH65_05855 [Paracoccaceae bacterium]|nr:hypothetical protein [Paracoccaceae bacterium]MDE2674617.1 hypothetical protein [Paracoccaceae bacterium]